MTRWSFDKKQQSGELVVTGAVTVAQVGELKGLLLEALEQSPEVQIDLAQVEQIDVAGLQLFCAAHRLAINRGKCITIKTGAESVRQLVRGGGFIHAAVCDRDRQSACLWSQLA